MHSFSQFQRTEAKSIKALRFTGLCQLATFAPHQKLSWITFLRATAHHESNLPLARSVDSAARLDRLSAARHQSAVAASPVRLQPGRPVWPKPVCQQQRPEPGHPGEFTPTVSGLQQSQFPGLGSQSAYWGVRCRQSAVAYGNRRVETETAACQ